MALVSVITPMYNSVGYIGNAIKSVQSQTLTDWEMIIVDDCSTDGSFEAAVTLSRLDSRISVYRLKENLGGAVARNFAIEKANSRYIAFLDSDDQWYESKLQMQVDYMRETGVELSYSAYDIVNESGEVIRSVGVPKVVSYDQLLKTCVIGCLTAVYDTYLLGKVYMPLIRKRQDYGLWLRILKKIDHAKGVNMPLARYTVRSDSISSNKFNAALYTWKLYREVEKLGLFKSMYFFSHYAFRGLLRTKAPSLARRLGVLEEADITWHQNQS